MSSGIEELSWQRSSRCGSSACVEWAADADTVYLRDSKNPDVVLNFDAQEWAAFLGALRTGELDLF